MAKKARKRLEEEEESRAFTFPAFDEIEFMFHELEQSRATLIALILTVSLGVASWLLQRFVGLWFVPVLVGIAVIAFSPTLVQRVRPKATEYTRGEWATLIMLQLFGWLGLWFLFFDLFRA